MILFLFSLFKKIEKLENFKYQEYIIPDSVKNLTNIYLLCDIKLIRQVNNWKPDEVGGFEVQLDDFSELEKMSPMIYSTVGYQLNVQTIKELNPQIFNWLELQNLNVWVIITLISLVAGITMISTLLIIVLENSRQIGLLKTIGADDKLISTTFSYISLNILFRGLIIGNIAGIRCCVFTIQIRIYNIRRRILLPHKSSHKFHFDRLSFN